MRGDLNTNKEAAKEIINAVNEYFGVDVVTDKRRNLEHMIPRHIARYLVRLYCKGLRLEIISEIFNVTHATVINSLNVIDDFRVTKDVEVTYNLNALILKIEAECESVRYLGNTMSKNTYVNKVVDLLDGISPERLKEVVSIIKSYKEAYKKIDSLIDNPLSVV